MTDNNQKEEQDIDFGSSMTDLMTSLMVIFILLLVLSFNHMENQGEKLRDEIVSELETSLKESGSSLKIEKDKKFANKILFKSVFLENTSEELELLEVPIRQFMIDKTLKELQLPDKFKIVIAGIIRGNKLTIPLPQKKLQAGDRLLVTGNSEDIEKLIEEHN